ncbi:MAG: hypothetical protein QM718_12920 [Steroidobacteraceae bacterium]
MVLFPGWYVEPLEPTLKDRLWMLSPMALPKWISYEPIRLRSDEVALVAFHLSQLVRSARDR